jgi:hypothetical protein
MIVRRSRHPRSCVCGSDLRTRRNHSEVRPFESAPHRKSEPLTDITSRWIRINHDHTSTTVGREPSRDIRSDPPLPIA